MKIIDSFRELPTSPAVALYGGRGRSGIRGLHRDQREPATKDHAAPRSSGQ
jgi:hypothetical protein